MSTLSHQFIQFALENNAIRFGQFTLKSGRVSPYFFNAGAFNHGTALAKLGEFYAATLQQHELEVDVLFGPAYKGIPLVCATAIGCANQWGRTLPFCFNRKEAKDHGEGGELVGHPLEGNIVMVDDVITAGTAFRETMKIIIQHEARLSGVLIALDRQERGLGEHSAIEEIRLKYQIPVVSIATLDDLIDYMGQDEGLAAKVAAMREYQRSVAPIG